MASQPVSAGADFTARTLARMHAQDTHPDLDTLLGRPVVVAPEDFTGRVLARIHSMRRRIRWLGAGVAATAALLVGALLLPQVWEAQPHAAPLASPGEVRMSDPPAIVAGPPTPPRTQAEFREGMALQTQEIWLDELLLFAEGLEGAAPLLHEDSLQALAAMSF